jgi:hypothetical protein
MQRFGTEEELAAGVAAMVPDACAEWVKRSLVAGIVAAETEPESLRDGASTFDARIRGWVIKKGDIDFVGVLSSAASAVGTFLATGALAPVAAVAAITALAKFVWTLHLKGAHLSSTQTAVLGCLQAMGPASAAELTAKLAAQEPLVDNVEAVLESLTRLEMGSTDLMQAVRLDGTRWVALV